MLPGDRWDPVVMQPQNSASDHPNMLSRIRHSVFRTASFPQDNRERNRWWSNTLILHFRPRKVNARTLQFTLSWGLGGSAAVLILLLFCTGLLLKFVYTPFPDRAYDSILILQNDVLFGQFVRNIHHWSGNFLLLVVFLHMLRVFFTGAFQSPRRLNWIVGICMFLVVLASNFTGYLMPWDQLAFWAVTICTGMLEYIPGVGVWLQRTIRGGAEIGQPTLSIFFAIHTAIIPLCLLVLMPFHFWRVRKAGGLVIPKTPDENGEDVGETVATIPNLILRELVTATVVVAFIFVFALLFNAPLEAKANPGLSPNPTKAPWYFVGIQEMLLHFHPLFAFLIIPIIVVGALVAIPYLKYDTQASGIWFCSRTGRRTAIIAAVASLIVTPTAIIADEFFIDFAGWMPAIPGPISTGLIPLIIVAAAILLFHLILKKKFATNKNEAVQAIFILLVTTFIIFTITGFFFRGEGMELSWFGGI